MRRFGVLSVALAMILGMGMPAWAGPPTTSTFEFFGFSCELTGEGVDGYVSLHFEDGYAFSDAALWLGGDPFEREPDLFSDFEAGEVSREGDTVEATIPLIGSGEPGEGENGGAEPVATLTVHGVVGAVVGQDSFDDRFRDGNRWVEISEMFTFFEAEADVALDETPLLATCSAEEGFTTETSTNPHAYRVRFSDTFLDCFGIPGADGSTLNLFAGEQGQGASLFLEIFPPSENGEGGGENGDHEGEPPELFGETEIAGLQGRVDVVIPLFDPFADEEPIAEAHVQMTIVEGETTSSLIVSQYDKVRLTETELLVSGSASISDGRDYDLSGCFGQSFEAKGISNFTEGPKTTGQPPANDAIEGAEGLAVGRSDSTQTKATESAPEMACSETFIPEEGEEPFEETFDLPIGKTVWYRTDGTGGPMTVDTAGSNFDTIVGVYELVEGELLQVACVDDVFDTGFSLQASATWDSAEGAVYYIQAGGFGFFQDPEFPEFSGDAQYGLLKIRLSG